MPKITYIVQVYVGDEWQTVKIFQSSHFAKEFSSILRQAGYETRCVTPTQLRRIHGYSEAQVRQAMKDELGLEGLGVSLEECAREAINLLEKRMSLSFNSIPRRTQEVLIKEARRRRTTLYRLVVRILASWAKEQQKNSAQGTGR